MVAAVTTRKSGKAEMAYVGEVPWHGLGQSLAEGAPIEQWRVDAGMEWQVKRSRVRFGEGAAQQVYEDHHVLFRSDTKEPLSVVGKNYQIVQPGECLEFFRDLVDGNGFHLNTAGTLFDGRRYWALARIGEDAVIKGDDRVGGFLLLSSSCDGSLATSAKFTTVRVVCNNTLSMALHAKDKSDVKITHRSTFDHAKVKAQLGVAHGQFAKFVEASRALAKVRMGQLKAVSFVESLLRDTKTVVQDDVRESRQFKRIMSLFDGSAMGGTLVTTEGSAWGLVNSVTEYVDHHARASTDSHRMASAWYGHGDMLKTAAFEKALALV